jgi:hypothetical protein
MEAELLPLDESSLEAATDVLHKYGSHHHWFENKPWRELDPIGRDEFLDIVAGVISAYLEAAQKQK